MERYTEDDKCLIQAVAEKLQAMEETDKEKAFWLIQGMTIAKQRTQGKKKEVDHEIQD